MNNLFFKRIISKCKFYRGEDKQYYDLIKIILEEPPYNLDLYKVASLHSSASKPTENGIRENNERLEYLGDAVLGLVVAEYLFKKYPLKNEGFLTDIRSRIVNRESLNFIGKKLGMKDFVKFNGKPSSNSAHKSLYGNALEAFIGAVYLDKGYRGAKRFIEEKVISLTFDIDQLVKDNPNYKSKVIEWAQKKDHVIRFDIVDEKLINSNKEYTALVLINGEPHGTGFGFSKKKAEQDAARQTCLQLNL